MTTHLASWFFFLFLTLNSGHAQTCQKGAGAERVTFCSPPGSDLVDTANITSNGGSSLTHCPLVDSEFGGATPDCTSGHFPLLNIKQAAGSWYSGVVDSPEGHPRHVTLTLPSSHVIFSISVTFPAVSATWLAPRIGRFRVQLGRDGDQPGNTVWKNVATYADDCTAIQAPCQVIGSGVGPYSVPLVERSMFSSGLTNPTSLAADLHGKQLLVNQVRLNFERLYAKSSDQVNERTWFYFMERLEVDGVCWCNGHARACANAGGCLCQDNTEGRTCDRCKEGYQKHVLSTGFVCIACNCSQNGSVQNSCNTTDYRENGRCECLQGYTGRLCDECVVGYHRVDSGRCEPCSCSAASTSQQCDQNGQCSCREGAGGLRCETCLLEYYGWTSQGCNRCNCHPFGSSSRECDSVSGECQCKADSHTGGQNCSDCLPGYSQLMADGCVRSGSGSVSTRKLTLIALTLYSSKTDKPISKTLTTNQLLACTLNSFQHF